MPVFNRLKGIAQTIRSFALRQLQLCFYPVESDKELLYFCNDAVLLGEWGKWILEIRYLTKMSAIPFVLYMTRSE